MKREGSLPADLGSLFQGLQDKLLADLGVSRSVLEHPTAKGDATEVDWRRALRRLPKRYRVTRGFVVDADSLVSDWIDLVVYDRQYSPLLFEHSGQYYVPAESVYAVFEVKQVLNRSTVEYAAGKAASVRKLRRTSVEIPHAGGVYPAKKPFPILAGILATESAWSPPLGNPFERLLKALGSEERLDFGCALRHGSFEVFQGPDDGAAPAVRVGSAKNAFLEFFLTLFRRLQLLGTVPAMDVDEWARRAVQASPRRTGKGK